MSMKGEEKVSTHGTYYIPFILTFLFALSCRISLMLSGKGKGTIRIYKDRGNGVFRNVENKKKSKGVIIQW